MGLFNKIITKIFESRRRKVINVLYETISKLKIGIYSKTYNNYSKMYNDAYAKLLSGAIICELLNEEHQIEDIQNFYLENCQLIRNEIIKLSEDKHFAKAFSYLYAAKIFYLVAVTGKIISDESNQLLERANELDIYIPNTYDICGEDNFFKSVYKISEFANSILNKELKGIVGEMGSSLES